ncbi:MAG TPA: hemolysin family protein [Chloroflexota bacterium]|nr:hemolysin family protein [Chloroflexota bacterium]
MDTATLTGLIVLVLLVLANGFFVATEFAIVAVRRSRLDELAAQGVPNAGAAKHVVGHLDTYIAACQLGITMASLALGWVGEPALAHLIEPPMEALVGQFAPAAAHGVAIGASFAVITALHIVIGELAPKGLALQRPESTALWVARPMRLFEFVFRWPIAFLNGIGNGVLRLAGLQPASGHEMVHTVSELRLLVAGSQQAGVVEESEARIASRAFTLADHTAGALMTPRTEVDAVPLDASREELIERVTASPHSRLPVYEGSLDSVVGILHVHDLVPGLVRPPETFSLSPLLRPPLFVPESKHADELLDEMRASRQQFAVVLEEYGGTAGIVTLENLLEALVGPIEDEPGVGGQATPAVAPEPDGSIIFDGLTRLDVWEEETGLRLGEADREAAETLGGLVMARLEHIPDVGEEAQVAGRTLRVEQLDGRRVSAVRLLPPPDAEQHPRSDGPPSGTPDGTPPGTPGGASDGSPSGPPSSPA